MLTSVEAKAEIFWTAFRSLNKNEKEAVIKKFFSDKEFYEDFIDNAIIMKREKEDKIPLDDYLNNKRSK